MKHQSSGVPAIPDDNAPLPPARRPTSWTVRRGRAIAFVCVGLAVALSLMATYVAWRSATAADARAIEVEQRLAALEEYVEGRGDYRDAEAERLEQQIVEGICDLLDQLPASPLLDQPRRKYGCGPGTPADQLRPAAGELARSSSAAPDARPSPTPTTPPDGAAPPSPPAGGTDPGPAVAPPAAPSPTRAPPLPAERPLLDVEPLTDPLCDALGVCL